MPNEAKQVLKLPTDPAKRKKMIEAILMLNSLSPKTREMVLADLRARNKAKQASSR